MCGHCSCSAPVMLPMLACACTRALAATIYQELEPDLQRLAGVQDHLCVFATIMLCTASPTLVMVRASCVYLPGHALVECRLVQPACFSLVVPLACQCGCISTVHPGRIHTHAHKCARTHARYSLWSKRSIQLTPHPLSIERAVCVVCVCVCVCVCVYNRQERV